MVIANYRTKRILIDNGSSADILYLSAFEHMEIGKDKLQPTVVPLVEFTGDKLYPAGVIKLLVTARASPRQVTKTVDFLVVDCSSTYNVIISRPMLNKLKVITSTYHLLMYFLTKEGVEEVKGD